MKKRLKLFAVFLLIVQIWTVNSQPTNGEFSSTTNLPSEDTTKLPNEKDGNTSSENYEKVTSNKELQSTTETIQTNNDNIEFKSNLKDEIFEYLKAQLEKKSKLPDIQINEASDYKHQTEREIENLQTTIKNYNATISKLKSANKQINLEKDELISQAETRYDKIKELESELYKTQLNHSNLSDENFKKYQRDQKSLLESCQMDLRSQYHENIDIRNSQNECEIKLKNKDSSNPEISNLKKELNDCQYSYGEIRYELMSNGFTLRDTTTELTKCNSSLHEITNKLNNCLQGDSSKCFTTTTSTTTTTTTPRFRIEESESEENEDDYEYD